MSTQQGLCHNLGEPYCLGMIEGHFVVQTANISKLIKLAGSVPTANLQQTMNRSDVLVTSFRLAKRSAGSMPS